MCRFIGGSAMSKSNSYLGAWVVKSTILKWLRNRSLIMIYQNRHAWNNISHLLGVLELGYTVTAWCMLPKYYGCLATVLAIIFVSGDGWIHGTCVRSVGLCYKGKLTVVRVHRSRTRFHEFQASSPEFEQWIAQAASKAGSSQYTLLIRKLHMLFG